MKRDRTLFKRGTGKITCKKNRSWDLLSLQRNEKGEAGEQEKKKMRQAVFVKGNRVLGRGKGQNLDAQH